MLDTFEVAEDLLVVAVVLTSSYDLGHRVNADVEQLADQFTYTATISLSGTSGSGREARSASTAIGSTHAS
jgi:hypothetical protein